MDLEEGAMVEPVAVAAQITKVGNVRPNQTVVVFGCGPIGLLCQAVSKAYAAKKVIGIDISQSRLDFAQSFGADGVFLPPARPEGVEETEWSEKVAKLIKDKFNLGEGPDVVLEATGAQSCIQTGVHLTKKGGTYVQAGMGKEVTTYLIPLLLYWNTNCTERCLSYHNSVHQRPDHPRVNPVFDRMLSGGSRSHSQRQDRCQEAHHEPVHVRAGRRGL